jgi:AsmA-like C-terminal region
VKGSFGPWSPDEPGATPLDGKFTFAKADLGVFKGISGILSAHGEFGGTLGRLSVHGQTDTPQFTVAVGGHPVPLHADYRTTVDGTNGDTLLDRIEASFLNTSLVAKGSVVGTPGKNGRTVTLDVVMDKARIEDVLRLVVKAPKAPMTGAMKLRTKFVIPPGDRDVVEKLHLAGQFSIGTARFTSLDIQKKIDELSSRSRGKQAADNDQPSVASNFRGEFALADGTLALRTLTFETPGSRVELAGMYNLRRETLGFKGLLLMDASISQTQKGWKRWALKVIDPLFAKKGGEGTELPIKIEGKRSAPAFGLDKGNLFKRRK